MISSPLVFTAGGLLFGEKDLGYLSSFDGEKSTPEWGVAYHRLPDSYYGTNLVEDIMNDFERGYNLGAMVVSQYEFFKAANQLRSMSNWLLRCNHEGVYCEADYKGINETLEIVEQAIAQLREVLLVKEMA